MSSPPLAWLPLSMFILEVSVAFLRVPRARRWTLPPVTKTLSPLQRPADAERTCRHIGRQVQGYGDRICQRSSLNPPTCLLQEHEEIVAAVVPLDVDAAALQTVGKRAVFVVELEDRLDRVVDGQVREPNSPSLGVAPEVVVVDCLSTILCQRPRRWPGSTCRRPF